VLLFSFFAIREPPFHPHEPPPLFCLARDTLSSTPTIFYFPLLFLPFSPFINTFSRISPLISPLRVYLYFASSPPGIPLLSFCPFHIWSLCPFFGFFPQSILFLSPVFRLGSPPPWIFPVEDFLFLPILPSSFIF